MITLYDREKNGIRVTALQVPLTEEEVVARQEAAKAKAEAEGKKSGAPVSRFKYVVKGAVTIEGEIVDTKEVEVAGYRDTAGAARVMFKELTDLHVPKVEKAERTTVAKADKALQETDPVKLEEMAAAEDKKATRAIARAAKLREAAAHLIANPVEVVETEAVDAEQAIETSEVEAPIEAEDQDVASFVESN